MQQYRDRTSRALARYALHTKVFAERARNKRVDAARPAEVTNSDPIHALSQRELEVLQLVADGLTDREIGSQLFITEYTVKGHVKRILDKLGSRNRAHAAAVGYRLRFLR
jgi:two-component system, NarL family, response regulator DevR